MSWVGRTLCKLKLRRHTTRLYIPRLLEEPCEWVCIHCGRRWPFERDTKIR